MIEVSKRTKFLKSREQVNRDGSLIAIAKEKALVQDDPSPSTSWLRLSSLQLKIANLTLLLFRSLTTPFRHCVGWRYVD